MDEKTHTLIIRTRGITFLSACLFLAACASPPSGTPDEGSGASGQSKDLISTSGLAAHYPFDGSARDAGRRGNHGTVHGDAVYVEDRFGKPESALEFDGVDDYVEVAPSKSLYVKYDNSISVWYFHRIQDDPKNWYSIVEKADPERYGHSKYGIWMIDNHAEFCIQAEDLEVQHWCIHSEVPLETGMWHHIAAVSNGRVLRVYVNGNLEVEKDFGWRTKLSNSEFPLFIGTDLYASNISYIRGTIDDLRLYSRALSEEEVMTLYKGE